MPRIPIYTPMDAIWTRARAAPRLDASEMARGSNPLERTSVQLMLGVALIALCANSAVDRTEDGVIPPWGRVRFGLWLRIDKERS